LETDHGGLGHDRGKTLGEDIASFQAPIELEKKPPSKRGGSKLDAAEEKKYIKISKIKKHPELHKG